MNRPTVHSLRTDRFHLLWDTSSDAIELFDTETDPDERVNVASDQAELASRLKQLLRLRLEQIDGAGTLEAESVPIPEDLRDRLRVLGYIN